MLEDKKLQESSNIIKKLIKEGSIVKPKEGAVAFFMEKSSQSVAVASRLLELCEEEELPAELWVINSSYYSMFFAATALLAKFGHSIKRESGIHKLTYHALVHYFLVEDSKIHTKLMELYKDAVDEAEELLQLSEEKINKMILPALKCGVSCD